MGSYDRYTWSYGAPINGSFQWITGVVIPISGVISPYLPLVGAYFVCDTCIFFSYFALLPVVRQVWNFEIFVPVKKERSRHDFVNMKIWVSS